MASITRTDVAPRLPDAIQQSLRAVGRRWRTVAVVGGLGRWLLAMALGLTLGVAVDGLLMPPTWVRWGLWLGWVALGLVLLARGVIGPLLRRLSARDLAAVAARAQPGQGTTLVSAVELLEPGSQPHGSPALIDAVAARAVAQLPELDLARAIPARSAGRWLTVGGLATLAVLVPIVLRPDPLAALTRRFVMPWADPSRLARFVVRVRPGDARIAAGSSLAIEAGVEPRYPWSGRPPAAAWLEWTGTDGVNRRVAMATDAGGAEGSGRRFEHTLQGLATDVRYRVVSGPASGAEHTITVIEPPAIQALTARIEPPVYTGRTAFEPVDPDRLSVWEQSQVTLSLAPSRPLARAEVHWPAVGADGQPTTQTEPLVASADGQRWSVTLPATASGPFEFTIEDRDGLAGRPEPPRRLRVNLDAPPEVALAGTEETLDARRDDVVLLDVAASDDVAVAEARIGYAVDRGTAGPPHPAGEANMLPDEGTIAADLDGLGTPAALGQPALGLKALNLRNGDVVRYWVEVADNRPEPRGPNLTRSSERSLRIVENAEPLVKRRAVAERAALRGRLEAIRRDTAGTHQGATQLRYAADAALRGNGRWDQAQAQALETRLREARTLGTELEELARVFKDSGLFASLARPTRQASEVEAEGARAMLDQARQANDPGRRLADLRAADGRLALLLERVDELLRRFDELARRDDDLRQLRLLAERQAELAEQARRLAEQGASGADLERLRQQQEQLQNAVDDLTRRSPELKAELLKQRAREAGALAERARALAGRQREQARRTNDANARQAALRALAQQQRTLQDEARRLALEVDPALQDNGRGRVDLAALERAEKPLDAGDIEQARPALDGAEDALRRLARELDDVRDDPRTIARRLARRQEELAQAAGRAIREAATPEQKAALPQQLGDAAARQQALLERLKPLAEQAPEPQRDAARQAVEAVERAATDLREGKLDPAPGDLDRAREAMQRLADALPDRNQRIQQAQGKINEARGKFDEVSRELERHVRETAPQPNRPHDPVASARDLAKRLEPLAQRQRQAIASLKALPAEPELSAAQNRAVARFENLAETIEAVRAAAPAGSDVPPAQAPLTDWRVLGPFAMGTEPMFPLDGFLDLKAVVPDRKRRPATWKPVVAGDRGTIDLRAAYPDDISNAAAFGVTEVPSPAAGPGTLALGSDDGLVVWVNGRKVYEFVGNRSMNFEQERVPITLVEGPNRILVKCSNGDGDWKYALSLTAPPDRGTSERLARVETLKQALTPLNRDASAGLDRLQQAFQNRPPADEQATELAADLQVLAQSMPGASMPPGPARDEARRIAASEARRVATALRELEAPDAPALRAEAVRQAQQAAQTLSEPPADTPADARADAPDPAVQAVQQAAQAVTDLARRLNDTQTPAGQAAALARAQRGLDEPGAPRAPADLARAEKAIAEELAHPVAPPDAETPRAAERAQAQAALAKAAALAERAAWDTSPAAPDAATQAQARRDAAQALEQLARAEQPGEPGETQPPTDLASETPAGDRSQLRPGDDSRHEDPGRPSPDKPATGPQPTDVARRPPGEAGETPADPDRKAQARNERAAMPGADPDRPASEPGANGPPQASDPAAVPITPEHAAAARDLARRQRQLRQQVQALLSDGVPPQERLRDEAAELGRALAGLRDQSRELSNRAQGPAQSAAEILQNRATPAMNQGAEHLARGQMPQARDAQRQAADHAEQAARAAEDTAAALRAEIPPELRDGDPSGSGGTPVLAQGGGQGQGEAASGPPNGDAEALTRARDAQRQAGQRLAQGRDAPPGGTEPSAQAASEAMQRAAQGLRSTAQRARSGLPGNGPPASRSAPDGQDPGGGAPTLAGNPDPQGGPGQAVDPQADPLTGALQAGNGRAWGELPGHLRTEILQNAGGRYRDDYARLIQLYFREIAGARSGR